MGSGFRDRYCQDWVFNSAREKLQILRICSKSSAFDCFCSKILLFLISFKYGMGASHASEATPMIEWILTEMRKGTVRNTAKFNSLTQVPQADGTHMSHTHNKPRACDADCSQCEQTQGVCCQASLLEL